MLSLVLSAAAAAGPFAASLASTWEADGQVDTVVRSGSSIFLGGRFHYVGPHTGGGALARRSDGTLDPTYPSFDGGSVRAVASDGSGGYFVGGTFTHVGTIQRSYLVHVLASGAVDTTFSPQPGGPVFALAHSGSVLYVGGDFGAIGGAARVDLAAVSATSGVATAWHPGDAENVSTIATLGPNVYVGASYVIPVGTQIHRNGLIVIDGTTGDVLPLQPILTGDVYSIAAIGTTLYMAGNWQTSASSSPVYAGALDAATGTWTSWAPSFPGRLQTVAADGTTVYALGSEATAVGNIHAFDAATGAARSGFDPPAINAAALAATDGVVYVGGFADDNVNGRVDALDAVTGSRLGWSLSTDGNVTSLAVDSEHVFAGGAFIEAGGSPRSGFAELDATTGRATSFDPAPTGSVRALAFVGSTLYVGGTFDAIAGSSRTGLAAFDLDTKALLPWTPHLAYAAGAEPYVLQLTASSVGVYFVGGFTSVDGTSISDFAGVDPTGSLLPFRPRLTGSTPTIDDLVATSTAVYVGGQFTSAGGAVRANVAALDPLTGDALAWNPGAGSPVTALAVADGTVYMCANGWIAGVFVTGGLAAVDSRTGALAWSSDAPCGSRIAAANGILYGTLQYPDIAVAVDTATRAWEVLPSAGGTIGTAVFATSDGTWVGFGLGDLQDFTTPAVRSGFAAYAITPGAIAGGGGGGGGSGGSSGGGSSGPLDLATTLSVSPSQVAVGGSAVVRIAVTDVSATPANHLHVLVTLPSGAAVASTSTDRGPGCRSALASSLDCDLDYLAASPTVGNVLLLLTFAEAGQATITATASADQAETNVANNTASATIQVGNPPPPPLSPHPRPSLPRPRLARLPSRALLRSSSRVWVLAGRLAVNEKLSLSASVTPRLSRHRVQLLSRSHLGFAQLRRASTTVRVSVPRAGTVTYRLLIAGTRLTRGRRYVLRLTGVNAEHRSATLISVFTVPRPARAP